jgi:periplasmic divalent cation tolerance protein
MSREVVVLVTVPDRDQANRIAEAIVSERLAACVNIIPGIESVYRWEGKVVRDGELLLVIKTTQDRYDELECRIKELHSYRVPEVIALAIGCGLRAYLDWLWDSTR